jgi:membrane-bound serine protease (ClpP class)
MMLRHRLGIYVGTLLLGLVTAGVQVGSAQNSGSALLLTVDGAIGPASADYILSGITAAEAGDHPLLIIEMDTPGGLDSAMRDIIKGILSSDVPVATYVSPGGSRAASAGTYILYASHIAAMHPVSNLGAATPVQIGGAPSLPDFAEQDQGSPSGGNDDGNGNDSDADASDKENAEPQAAAPPADAMKAKMVNDAVAYIKGLAEQRGRNAEWAESAVRDAVSLPASEALEQNVIDVVANSVEDLLTQIDGRVVDLNGSEVTLQTAGLGVERLEPDWRTSLLMIITDPSVAYLLMLVGIYGLLLEGYNPGALVPGVIGGICLLLALFAFQVLPVNYAGLALMLVGVALMIAEGFAPSFGILGFGGLAAFVFGSIILMDTDVPGFGISMGLIAGVATVAGLALLGLVYMLMKARNRPVVSGLEGMIGHLAEALEDFDDRGSVFLDGERWTAVSPEPVKKGQRLEVIAIEGLVAQVQPLHD